MTKLIIHLFTIIVTFFAIWFLLSRIDWVDIFNVHETTDKTEDKIGQLYVDMIQQNESVIEIDSLTQPITDIIDQILKANDLDADVKLHIIQKSDINAFAIPDDNLVLFTGLIEECNSPEELAGVLGHEIAHMEMNHVMKKLVKEVGLSVLLSMASGGNGSVIHESFKTLTSSAYDRKLESEADLTSVEYLREANIDYKPFAEFLFRLSLDENEQLKHLNLLQSHPPSEARAKSILENESEYSESFRPLMTEDKWETLKLHFGNYDE